MYVTWEALAAVASLIITILTYKDLKDKKK